MPGTDTVWPNKCSMVGHLDFKGQRVCASISLCQTKYETRLNGNVLYTINLTKSDLDELFSLESQYAIIKSMNFNDL